MMVKKRNTLSTYSYARLQADMSTLKDTVVPQEAIRAAFAWAFAALSSSF